jgi:hypothetical protein
MVYDAPADSVAAMLSDPAFREEVCREMRAISHEVRIDGGASAKRVRIEMVQPTDGVPSVAAKIVGSTTEIVQEEVWSSPTDGKITVTIPGKPGEMSGTATLVEKDGGTREQVRMEIKVRIPLVAGKVEGVLAKVLRSALQAEERVGRKYLAG